MYLLHTVTFYEALKFIGTSPYEVLASECDSHFYTSYYGHILCVAF